MNQLEKLAARITQLLKENPSKVVRLAIVVDTNGQPLLWYSDEPVKVEGRQENKPLEGV